MDPGIVNAARLMIDFSTSMYMVLSSCRFRGLVTSSGPGTARGCEWRKRCSSCSPGCCPVGSEIESLTFMNRPGVSSEPSQPLPTSSSGPGTS